MPDWMHRQPCRRWLLALACVFLQGAQALGLLHAYEHLPGSGLPAQQFFAAPSWAEASGLAHAHGDDCRHAPEQGFGHDGQGAECRLYDQLLGHADLLLLQAPAHGVSQTGALPPPAPPALGITACVLGYLARAPPPDGPGSSSRLLPV